MIDLPRFSLDTLLSLAVYYPNTLFLYFLDSKTLARSLREGSLLRFDVCPPILGVIVTSSIYPIFNFFLDYISLKDPSKMPDINVPFIGIYEFRSFEATLFFSFMIFHAALFFALIYPVYLCCRRNNLPQASLVAIQSVMTAAWIIVFLVVFTMLSENLAFHYRNNFDLKLLILFKISLYCFAILMLLKVFYFFRNVARAV